jgi:hypothetical protein
MGSKHSNNKIQKNQWLLLLSFPLIILSSVFFQSCEGPGTIEQNVFLEDTLYVTQYDTITIKQDSIIRDTFLMLEKPYDWELIQAEEFDTETGKYIDTVILYYESSVFSFTVGRNPDQDTSGIDKYIFTQDIDGEIEIVYGQYSMEMSLPIVVTNERSGARSFTNLIVMINYGDFTISLTAQYIPISTKLLSVSFHDTEGMPFVVDDRVYQYSDTINTSLVISELTLNTDYLFTNPGESNFGTYRISGLVEFNNLLFNPSYTVEINSMTDTLVDVFNYNSVLDTLRFVFQDMLLDKINDETDYNAGIILNPGYNGEFSLSSSIVGAIKHSSDNALPDILKLRIQIEKKVDGLQARITGINVDVTQRYHIDILYRRK